ncbi:MAG: hypothetical protein H7252_02400 [Cytophaga sp.]|nr:hypothetical protein [Undibacterium sp.]
MHSTVVQFLAGHHAHLNFQTRDFEAGLGWVCIVDELFSALPAGTDIHGMRDVDGRLQVSATGVAIVTHMLSAAWRRSAAICPHCAGIMHLDICLP